MTNKDIVTAAHDVGFTHAGFSDVAPFVMWERAERPPYLRLYADPLEAMPSARTIITLALCYEPFKPLPKGYADISAYYVASNATYGMVHKLAKIIQASGAQANVSPNIPEKPACARAGMGAYGLNQQLLVDEHGRPCVLQTILTDLVLDTVHGDEAARAEVCGGCEACVDACPTRALDGGYDRDMCIRNYMFTGFAVKEEMRAAFGKRLLGCDACLAACMRREPTMDMPQPLQDALFIDGLLDTAMLSGKLDVLSQYIGSNYARAHRVLAHAVIAAANEGERYRLTALEALIEHDDAIVREHARWAVEQLTINSRK